MTDREAIRRLLHGVLEARLGRTAESGLIFAKLAVDLDSSPSPCAFAVCATCEKHMKPDWCRCYDGKEEK